MQKTIPSWIIFRFENTDAATSCTIFAMHNRLHLYMTVTYQNAFTTPWHVVTLTAVLSRGVALRLVSLRRL